MAAVLVGGGEIQASFFFILFVALGLYMIVKNNHKTDFFLMNRVRRSYVCGYRKLCVPYSIFCTVSLLILQLSTKKYRNVMGY